MNYTSERCSCLSVALARHRADRQLTSAVVLWRSNELIQRPEEHRKRLIAALVLQLFFAIAHWLAYIAVIGARKRADRQAITEESVSEEVNGDQVVTAHLDDELSDTDDEDLVDADMSRRSSIVQRGALLRSRSVSGPISARLAAYRSYSTLAGADRLSPVSTTPLSS